MNRREFLCGIAALPHINDKLSEATALLKNATAPLSPRANISAASLLVKRHGLTLVRQGFGFAHDTDTVFLLASISKPMTAAGVMVLADSGQLTLQDPVHKFIPEFSGGDKDMVTIRHLLTHTSGLPDMLPENVELRKRHAPLRSFVAATCKTPLLFKPGTQVSYQSMGYLLLAEIAERITREPFRQLLRKDLFLPLGMTGTSLGLDGRKISDTALCQVKGNDEWNWNSPYWRDLGAPWGGVHSTATDVARFLELFLNPTGKVLKRETAASMIANQTPGLNEAWGFGWMVKEGAFGKKCSPKSYGHYGSTGTVAWADPTTSLVCVLLTTKPIKDAHEGLLGEVSDLVSESV